MVYLRAQVKLNIFGAGPGTRLRNLKRTRYQPRWPPNFQNELNQGFSGSKWQLVGRAQVKGSVGFALSTVMNGAIPLTDGKVD